MFRRKAPSEAAKPPLHALSLLAPEELGDGVLPSVVWCGRFADGEASEAAFEANPAFVTLLHEVIAETGKRDPGLIAAARQQREGYLYVIDLRTPNGPQGDVPLEDIVGAFKVENGQLVEGGYKPFSNHKLFTRNGILRLPPSFHAALIASLKAAARTPARAALTEAKIPF